jgi:hypothetical protein
MPGDIDPGSMFPFQRDRQGNRVESVYWRKYARLAADLHKRGCEIERLKNIRLQSAGKPPKKYSGFRAAPVGSVRKVITQRRWAFAVTHAPENGDLAHAHIEIVAAADNSAGTPNPNDIRELVHMLVQRFGQLDGHACGAPSQR